MNGPSADLVSKGIPAPGLRRTNGYLNMMFRQRDPPRFYQQLARRFGDVAYFRFGPVDSYLVSHPDDVRDVFVTNARKFGRPLGAKILRRMLLGDGLLTSEGDFHLRQRRMIQPAFHRPRIAGYARVMVEHAARAGERWQQHPDGQAIDVAEEMMRLTLGVVGKTLLDTDVDRDAPEVGEALETLFRLFDKTSSPLHILLGRLGLSDDRPFRAARATLDDIVYRIIRERRAAGGDRGDLLSMLLAASDVADAGGGSEDGVEKRPADPSRVWRMSDQLVRDETMTLFLAGHETTALALSWAWHLLGGHPQAEERLHAEVDELLGGRLPTFDDLPRLEFTEAVFAETLRLYPPAWLLGRSTLTQHELRGHPLAPRSMVVVSPWVIHRDPRFYDEPERFVPDRWTPAFKASLPKLAYLPFGGGNRVCIGEGFAWTEGILVLATLAQRWRLRPAGTGPVGYRAMLTLRPRGGLPMRLQRRRS